MRKSLKPIPLPCPSEIMTKYDVDLAAGKFYRRGTAKEVGTRRPKGYVFICVGTKRVAAHRLIYLLAYGSDPGDFFVDHINGDASDNRPENLRLATLAQNTRNMKSARRDSSTQIRGVQWHKRDRIWYASVTKNGKSHHVGCYKDIDAAIAAVRSKRTELFGEFSGDD